ncbi:MAG: inorganic phosphate transporter, partial [Nitrospina sp.]|nr:inorganic phosphate transporter [Nitrospina sp.]
MVLAVSACIYMACNIGANDVANAMGTSVGSSSLTFKQAIYIAAIAEFAGAFFVGGHVSDTIRKGMLDPTIFSETPIILVYGMIAALLSAALWLNIASYLAWPVSTTHSIVGAVVGFGIMAGGMDAI